MKKKDNAGLTSCPVSAHPTSSHVIRRIRYIAETYGNRLSVYEKMECTRNAQTGDDAVDTLYRMLTDVWMDVNCP